MRLGLSITIIACTIILSTIQAEAAQPIKGVAVTIEKTCQLSKNCVTYADLAPYDNSPKQIGELVTKNGVTKRMYTPIQDNPEWLRFIGKSFVIIDAPPKIADRVHQITITSDLKQYHMPSQYTVKEVKNNDAKPTTSVRQYSHSWYVDRMCHNGTITSKDWKTLLPAMIDHLNSGCKTPMPYSNISQDIKPITKTPIGTSYKYKHDTWLETIKKDCTKQRNACTDLKQPTRAGLKP